MNELVLGMGIILGFFLLCMIVLSIYIIKLSNRLSNISKRLPELEEKEEIDATEFTDSDINNEE